jgi:hypothetical protein
MVSEMIGIAKRHLFLLQLYFLLLFLGFPFFSPFEKIQLRIARNLTEYQMGNG